MHVKFGLRLVAAAAVLSAPGWAALFEAGTGAAHADTGSCLTVNTSKGAMTTARYDTPVTGLVDATGCQIGAYYDAAGTGDSVSAAEIENATDYGVFVDGGTGNVSVDITGSSIHNIGDTPFDGVQRGNAIYYYGYNTAGTASGTVSGNAVSEYQKGGIVVSGEYASTVVTDNTVTGLGPVAFIAQNGVQFGYGATGSVSGNQISDNYYTGCSNHDAAKTGCTPYVSTGLLLYDIDPSQVSSSNNHFRDDQRNSYVATASEVSAHS